MRPSPEAWVGCTINSDWVSAGAPGGLGGWKVKEGKKRRGPKFAVAAAVAAKRGGSRTERDIQLEISFCDRHSLRPLPGGNVKAQAQA
jgi:hypothetical protein